MANGIFAPQFRAQEDIDLLREMGRQESPLAQTQFALNQNAMNRMQSLGNIQRGTQQGMFSGLSNLRASGGLDTGARERLAQRSIGNIATSTQAAQGESDRIAADLLSQDAAQKFSLLQNIPGLQFGQDRLQNQFLANQAQAEALEEQQGKQQLGNMLGLGLGAAGAAFGGPVGMFAGQSLGQLGGQLFG